MEALHGNIQVGRFALDHLTAGMKNLDGTFVPRPIWVGHAFRHGENTMTMMLIWEVQGRDLPGGGKIRRIVAMRSDSRRIGAIEA